MSCKYRVPNHHNRAESDLGVWINLGITDGMIFLELAFLDGPSIRAGEPPIAKAYLTDEKFIDLIDAGLRSLGIIL